MTTPFQNALDWLGSFISFEKKMPDVYSEYVVDPYRIHRLLDALGQPQKQFKSIHIAGTKGKGSTAAFCTYCLREAGLRVGLYTSPHLYDIRERFRVLTFDDKDGRITPSEFVELVEELKPATTQVPNCTWFDLTTALAFLHFAHQEVDIAVIEVGLGGRLDSTNVILPEVSIITSISLEHTDLLGDTVAAIAKEKAGIIKPGVPVVSAPQKEEAEEVIGEIAVQHSAPLFQFPYALSITSAWGDPRPPIFATHDLSGYFPELDMQEFTSGLLGEHQQENAAVALVAMRILRRRFPSLTVDALQRGIAATRWPGRLQLLRAPGQKPGVLLDGAHNADSAEKLAESVLSYFNYNKLWLLVGMTSGKDVTGFFEALLPLCAGICITQANNPRALAAADLAKQIEHLAANVTISPNLEDGLKQLEAKAAPSDLICVTGSLYIVGDLLKSWNELNVRTVADSSTKN